jgi:hypothetical protein
MATLAQAPRKFYMRFGGNGYDVGYDVKQTLDNGYIITGSTSSFGQGNTDLYLVKLDSMGNKKFEKSFGSYNNEIGKSVLQLFDSSYVAVGYTNSTGFGGYDIFLVKTDKNGNLLWEKTIGGSDWDFAYSLQATNDGGFVIAGTTYSYGRGNADGYVVKTDGSGNVVWTKTYGGAYDDEFKSVVQTADGGFALTGYTKSYNDIDSGDVWVFKLDNMGDSTWCKFFGGGKEDFGNEIIQHPSTELYIVGGTRSYSANPNYMSAYAIRLLIDGSFNSDRIDNTSTTDQIFNSIVVSKRASNFYVNTISYFTVGGYQKQVKVLEMDFGLNYANAVGVGSILDDELYKIIITKDKGYACVGFTQGDGAILEDGYFIKFDSLLNYGSFSTVSVNEITEPEIMFSVFPNPVNQEFTIMSGDNIKFKKIQLFDCIGREINLSNRIQHVSGNQLKINVEDIPSGAYQLILDRKSDKLIILH